jgi:Peptidase C13 family
LIVGAALCCVLCEVPAFAQQTHLLVVTGVAGDEDHAKKFSKWASSFIDAAKKKDAVPDANITLLADPVPTGPKGPVLGRATKDGVEKAISDIAARAKASDTIFILLIGHGSFDGRGASFNLPGPDLTAADYAKLLSRFTSQHVVFVNTASASGAFLQPLAAPGRVIVTATKTGGERNETDFPEYFVAAYNDDAADLDRNGHISVREAFDYASSKVKQAFQQKGYMLTEHATLEDGGEGQLASTVFLGTGRADAALNVDMSDPAAKALVEERDAIEKNIAALRLMKPSMDTAAYDAQMEKLLTDLALKTKALRDLQAKKAKP